MHFFSANLLLHEENQTYLKGRTPYAFITSIHILRSANQLSPLLHKDVNQTDAHLGVLLDISDADGRRNMRDDQMPFIESCKDFFG